MKPIVVRDQVRLSSARCLYLTLAGMYYRITRSAITIVIVALAVAFLSYMLSYSVFVQDLSASASREFKESRLLGEWVSRLGHPDRLNTVVAGMISGDTARTAEYRRWSGADEPRLAQVREACRRYGVFLSYFDTMRKISRAVLLGDTDPHALPDLLSDRDYLSLFLRQLKELSLKPPMGSPEALETFLHNDWPLVAGFYDNVQQGQTDAIGEIRTGLAGRPLLGLLIEKPDEIRALTMKAGFSTPGSLFVKLSSQARIAVDQSAVMRLLGIAEVKAAMSRELSINQKKLDLAQCLHWVSSLARAQMFCRIAQAGIAKGDSVPGPGSVLAVASTYRRTEQLQRAIGNEQVSAGAVGLAALPQATKWLIIVSFLVCAVGICNTMFMSVTERFTEIATMKCLGAMDGFVMRLFVFEAVIQGVAGSVCGIVLGFVLTLLRGVAGYGGMFFDAVPVGALLITIGFSLLAGVFLAAVSAVGPAWMAARLAPMEAMRVE